MAVTVKQTNKNKYKMHRALTPDGSVLEFTENKISSSYNGRAIENNNNRSLPITTAYNDTLSQNDPVVNTQKQENSDK